jgi:ABC-type Fe3+/spermidine/putrescine transport system ATPase subunit
MTALELRGVAKRYGRTTAVDDVSLSVADGELVALVGPSGCGKSTLLMLAAGLLEPDAGQVLVGDRVVAGGGAWVPPEDRRVGVVFQDAALFPHLRVADNIAFGVPRGRDRAPRVAELLALVGLPDHGRRYPHELSGGQQQRVALARALAPRPSVVLFDEAFGNLDHGLRSSCATRRPPPCAARAPPACSSRTTRARHSRSASGSASCARGASSTSASRPTPSTGRRPATSPRCSARPTSSPGGSPAPW